jgi:galactokinase
MSMREAETSEITDGNLKGLEEMIQTNREQSESLFHDRISFTAVAPGRINIIGEHTDYNQGLSLPVAINRWVVISFMPTTTKEVCVKSLNYHSDLKFSIDEAPKVTESWQKFVWGAFEIFKDLYPVTHGFNALIQGNIPIGSGVSSSAAIEVAMMNGLRKLYNADFDDFALILLCQRIEHEYLNVNSGLLDQYASQFSRVGKILLLDFDQMVHHYVTAEIDKCTWVLVDSKVQRELAKSSYSDRVEETRAALVFLLNEKIGIEGFRDIKEEHISLLPNEIWRKRIRHYVTENDRVMEAVDCITYGKAEALGKLLIKSHNSLSKDYEVSCKELDYLMEEAIKIKGCLGSRMMGGGFGGCTINLVRNEDVADFTKTIKSKYEKEFNKTPNVNVYTMVEGGRILR